jgi:hypothetical protein
VADVILIQRELHILKLSSSYEQKMQQNSPNFGEKLNKKDSTLSFCTVLAGGGQHL